MTKKEIKQYVDEVETDAIYLDLADGNEHVLSDLNILRRAFTSDGLGVLTVYETTKDGKKVRWYRATEYTFNDGDEYPTFSMGYCTVERSCYMGQRYQGWSWGKYYAEVFEHTGMIWNPNKRMYVTEPKEVDDEIVDDRVRDLQTASTYMTRMEN